MSFNLLLGIDIGTTSLKTLVIDKTNKDEILSCHSETTKANVGHLIYDEQNINMIIFSLNRCLEKIKEDLGQVRMAEIAKVAVCGQMHGCIFWKSDHVNNCSSINTKLGAEDVSHLITWQDGRCDSNFLQALPVSATSPLRLSTGFGCSSILWLKKYNKDMIEKYDCCGTVADYVVARLCRLTKPMMSNQNAVGWGYFNPGTCQWDYSVMERVDFPIHLLPTVQYPGTIAGKLTLNFHGISSRADVMVAMGDMQCSVMSCQIKRNEAVINLSTSAQLSMLVEKEDHVTIPEGLNQPQPATRVPFFGNYDLLTSASLNGGAVFANFVAMLTKWTQIFSGNVTESMVYEQLTSECSITLKEDQLPVFNPTVYGERHDPDARASASNIGPEELSFAGIARCLARGILQNLRSMFETHQPVKDIRHLWACGGAFSQNRLFREAMSVVFHDVTVSFVRDADAAYGAVLSVCDCADILQV